MTSTMQSHTHSPGDFCFVRSDELREALGEAYATTQKYNLWQIFRDDGPYVFLAHLNETEPISDTFRAMAYKYMTRISIYGWDAFVAYYAAESQKPRQPCLLDSMGAGAGSNKSLTA